MLKVDIVKNLPDFKLQVAIEVDKEILVLFGPSGAGKSLTLGCIAGLVKPDAGMIQMDAQIFFQSPNRFVPVHKRGIGVVFQGYALFPHLTVAQNLTYGLRYARDTGGSVPDMLRRLKLETLAERYPHQLSGGQQQRVALGRALIIKPRLLLLDEPFSALDRGVRERLQADITQLQQELELTVVYITHNLEDAFVLGDKLAVIRNGKVCQFGPISEVFSHPVNRSVAEITGVVNIWRGEVVESTVAGLKIRWGEMVLDRPPANFKTGTQVSFYIRPEDVKIIRPDKMLTNAIRYNLMQATITHIADRGVAISMIASSPRVPASIHLRFPPRSYQDLDLRVGQQVTLSLRRDAITLLPAEQGDSQVARLPNPADEPF